MLKNRIKHILIDAGLSQTDLANHMNIDRRALYGILNRSINMRTALNLADAIKELTGVTLTLNDFRKEST